MIDVILFKIRGDTHRLGSIVKHRSVSETVYMSFKPGEFTIVLQFTDMDTRRCTERTRACETISFRH